MIDHRDNDRRGDAAVTQRIDLVSRRIEWNARRLHKRHHYILT